ncbi:hypothetical protein BS78_05G030700 [Paspalum vaginatum]|nr:hypothetical protein BS78_05G030700 [Paspalum vaginatum]
MDQMENNGGRTPFADLTNTPIGVVATHVNVEHHGQVGCKQSLQKELKYMPRLPTISDADVTFNKENMAHEITTMGKRMCTYNNQRLIRLKQDMQMQGHATQI